MHVPDEVDFKFEIEIEDEERELEIELKWCWRRLPSVRNNPTCYGVIPPFNCRTASPLSGVLLV